MNNNDIFKKLRVALMLRDDQIVDIMELVDFRMSKGEIGNFFRKPDNPNYVECGDQVLRNFLNGLVIYLRGTKENPKEPSEELDKNRENVRAAETKFPKDINTKTAATNNPKSAKPAAKRPLQKAKPKKIQIVEKVRYNNGKKK